MARSARRGFTLIELSLALSLMVMLAYFAMVSFQGPLQRSALPESGRRLRSLIGMVRMRAMMDGLRYRIRFVAADEERGRTMTAAERHQPVVEVERDPIELPGEFDAVRAAWVGEVIFIGDVWCYQIRVGEPTFDGVMHTLVAQELEDERERKAELDLAATDDWVLLVEPDGTAPWMSFRLIDFPEDDFVDTEMETYPQLDVILDGRLGRVFLQRPLFDDEIAVLQDHGHSPLLRRDFMGEQRLSDDNVLEIDMGGR